VILGGMACTLYPLSWETAVTGSGGVDFATVNQSFMAALIPALQASGLDLRMPSPGTADQAFVIRGRVVRADPGSQAMRYVFSALAGFAIFEVEFQVGNAAAPFAHFVTKGTRRMSAFGGNSQMMLSDAAKLAGEESAGRIIQALAVAPR
jgi:hypothetical protein